jgi:transposase InsO family protein
MDPRHWIADRATAVKSPASSGMSWAFVKTTFERDYLRMYPLPDAPSVLRQIVGWIDDYNKIHSHSALPMVPLR